MPLSLNEIRSRANQFANDWKDEVRERAEKDTFWNEFFNVFGLNRRRIASFEEPAKRLNGKGVGFIDLFWKGTLIAEHKSAGKDLGAAFEQATDYFHGLKDNELPRYIIVTDFARIRLYDLEEKSNLEFKLEDLPKQIEEFGFLSGYKKHTFLPEDPANIKAAELMGELHDSLAESGYIGTKLEVFLVRILFILFADDTQIWEKGLFQEYIQNRTSEDGTDTGDQISKIFRVLNTPAEKRSQNLNETLQGLNYINGGLFAEVIDSPDFNSKMRDKLLACSKFDWSNISPAVFGSLFQHVMNKEQRRSFGAHYTEEKNILKTIKPLFLDELTEEFEIISSLKNKNQRLEKLYAFQTKLAGLNFLDPACGCGNFLVITYREIRKLELETVKEINRDNGGQMGIAIEFFSKVNVNQFYGIEIEEFPAKIAETAMWLMDHLMNLELSTTFGEYFARLPLKQSAKIVYSNALRLDWNEVIPAQELDYILGNPPFVGKQLRNKEQQEEMEMIFKSYSKTFGILDYVTCWYIKAAEMSQTNPKIQIAFVSTNSISQGEQVGALWQILFDKFQMKIKFAHQTFAWSSEAIGKANVFCVIIGYSKDVNKRRLFSYETVKSEPVETNPININPYLVGGGDILISAKTKPICNVPEMYYGSKPVDNGNLLFDNETRNEILQKEPIAEKYIKPVLGAKEFLDGKQRWGLWLVDANPSELKLLPLVLERVRKVKEFRLLSTKLPTREAANRPTLFAELRIVDSNFVLIPSVSSENRDYVPFGYFSPEYKVLNSCFALENASLYHFGLINSRMHNAWIKSTCGRLKSDIRYSNTLVYNNFPWPGIDGEVLNKLELKNEKMKAKIEELAQNILDTRAKYPDSSLADLYDPIAMPPDLRKAHQELDKAVELSYRKEPFKSDTERVEFLFERYQELVKK
jgi:N-6 DNA Methylase